MLRGIAVSISFFFLLAAPSCSREEAPARPARTVVVPTLDTPIPQGKSAIWCASFQLAWNELKKLARGPVQVENAEEIAARLNQAGDLQADLPAGSFYAKAGFARDGIVETIRHEMAERFPDKAFPDFKAAPDAVAVAYAYLVASVPFQKPFFDEGTFSFHDSSGKTTRVACFGLKGFRRGSFVRGQVAVIHSSGFGDAAEFVLDPSKGSFPNQIILARVPREETLAKTLEKVEKLQGPGGALEEHEELLIPNMSFLIDHHFKELEGLDKRLSNADLKGLYIALAMQSIRFKLDRSGATLESEARIAAAKKAASPREFRFDRPFLIVMKKRGGKDPFFVMWVDNAELLSKS